MRGAAFLSGVQDAIVVDIGGTTSDIGRIASGLAVESSIDVSVAGVSTNFRMPESYSFGLGGGSLVHLSANGSMAEELGPRSVAYRLTEEAVAFGGPTLTVTDIAVAAGLVDIGDVNRVKATVSPLIVATAQAIIQRKLEGKIFGKLLMQKRKST